MKHNRSNHAYALLRRMATEVELMIEDRRTSAGFHALEAMEATNQDAAEQRDKARRLAAEASGCLEVLKLIREAMAGVK